MSARRALLTVFGLGLMPKAPGTFGSVPPVVLAVALASTGAAAWTINIALIVVGLAFVLVCLQFGTQAEQTFGRKDPPQVVADEIAGQSLPLLFLPWMVAGEPRAMLWNGALALTAFVMFRLFDILKPPPVRAVERTGGGAGILLDDLVAGVYALIATQLIAHFALPQVL